MLLVSEGNNLILLALVFLIPEYANHIQGEGSEHVKISCLNVCKGSGTKNKFKFSSEL